jgi:hypothetical protein
MATHNAAALETSVAQIKNRLIKGVAMNPQKMRKNN